MICSCSWRALLAGSRSVGWPRLSWPATGRMSYPAIQNVCLRLESRRTVQSGSEYLVARRAQHDASDAIIERGCVDDSLQLCPHPAASVLPLTNGALDDVELCIVHV
jgi:hypothetical protein